MKKFKGFLFFGVLLVLASSLVLGNTTIRDGVASTFFGITLNGGGLNLGTGSITNGANGVFSGDVNASNINADNIFLNNSVGISGNCPNRPMISSEAKTYNVPADYTTINEALCNIPYIVRHRYDILIADGTYAEDVWIPPFMIGDIMEASEGSVQAVKIYGESESGVLVRSLHISGSVGALSPSVNNMTITGTEPTSDENTAIAIYGSQGAELKHIDLTGNPSTIGILCYDCGVTLSDINLGSNDLVGGVQVKHNGRVTSQDGGLSGTVTGYVYSRSGGTVLSKGDTATGSLGFLSQETANPLTTGYLFRQITGLEGGVFYGVNQFNLPLINLTTKTNDGNTPVKLTRVGADSQSAIMYIDDADLVFTTTQDETSGDYGGFEFNMDSGANPLFKINNGNVTISELSGSGNAFACLDSNGKLYRSGTACS